MCRCDFFNNLFNKPINTGETVETAETTSSTEVVIATPKPEEEEEPILTEKDMERLEIEKDIIDYALKMGEGKVRFINQIAVHCTATKEGKEVTIEDIDAWHKARGFKKQKISGHYCGYHYVIALDGTIMCGRVLSETGAHVSGYNSNSIGVCYVGGLDGNMKPKDTRTPEQKEALKWLIATLKKYLGIKIVKGHRDYSPDTNNNGIIEEFEWIKSCPCFDAIPEYKTI